MCSVRERERGKHFSKFDFMLPVILCLTKYLPHILGILTFNEQVGYIYPIYLHNLHFSGLLSKTLHRTGATELSKYLLVTHFMAVWHIF